MILWIFCGLPVPMQLDIFSVCHSGIGSILHLISNVGASAIQEAAVDLVCQLSSYEPFRAPLSGAGTVSALAKLILLNQDKEVR